MWLLGKQTWDFACNRTRADRPTSLITHPGDNFDRGPCAFLSATGSRPRSKKKKKRQCDTTSSHLFLQLMSQHLMGCGVTAAADT